MAFSNVVSSDASDSVPKAFLITFKRYEICCFDVSSHSAGRCFLYIIFVSDTVADRGAVGLIALLWKLPAWRGRVASERPLSRCHASYVATRTSKFPASLERQEQSEYAPFSASS